MERYNIKIVEKKWQGIWAKNKANSAKLDKNKKKFYCLEMFPYPSGKMSKIPSLVSPFLI